MNVPLMISAAGRNIPSFVYGTAWKENETERLVGLALEAGFRGIDTANQRRHYFEAGVGAAMARAISEGLVRRQDLFLQTKFTSADGQDHRLPYDRKADYATQVRQSFESSLEHLQVEMIDSYLLHGPSQRRGLATADHEVWRAMEQLHLAGRTRFLGISNVAINQLEELWAFAQVRPTFVQNRCYARLGWDREIRTFCREKSVVYQGFSLLTANAAELRQKSFQRLAQRLNRTPAQIVFRFAYQTGMQSLTGTTDPNHMREDLEVLDFELTEEDLSFIEGLGG